MVGRNYDLPTPFLEDFVDGFPEDLREPARCAGRVPVQLVTGGELDALASAVRIWWEARGATLTWDPERRRFVAAGRWTPDGRMEEQRR